MPRPAPSARVMLSGVALAAAAIVVAVLAFLFWPWGGDVYTDADTISQPASRAPLRDILWQPPAPISAPINTAEEDYEPRLSADGLTLFFVRGKAGRNAEVFSSMRTPSGWSEPQPLESVNSADDDLGPQPSVDGSALYFYSNRPGGQGGYDLWVTRRDGDKWSAPANLGAEINTPYNEYSPALSSDASVLVFASNRPRPGEAPDSAPPTWPATIRESARGHDYDLYSVSLSTDQGSTPEPLTSLNTAANEGTPAFSPVGDFLYFSSDRPGGLGGLDLFRSRRLRGHFERPANLKDPVNTPFNDLDPSLSQSGFAVAFSSDRPVADQAGAADYNIFTSTSREVFREARQADVAGTWGMLWPKLLWLLLALLALLLLAFLYRDARRRHLSILAKCLLASLAIHALIMLLLNLWGVTNSLGEFFKHPGGSRVILTDAPAGASDGLTAQIRGQITDSAFSLPDSPLTAQEISIPLTQPSAVPEIAPPVAQLFAAAQVEPALREAEAPDAPRTVTPAAPDSAAALQVNLPAQAQPTAGSEPLTQTTHSAPASLTPQAATQGPASTPTTDAEPTTNITRSPLANSASRDAAVSPTTTAELPTTAPDPAPSIAARLPDVARPQPAREGSREVPAPVRSTAAAPLSPTAAVSQDSTTATPAAQPPVAPLAASSPRDASSQAAPSMPQATRASDIPDAAAMSVAIPAGPQPTPATGTPEPSGASLALSPRSVSDPSPATSLAPASSTSTASAVPSARPEAGSSFAASVPRDAPVESSTSPPNRAAPATAILARGLSEAPQAAASLALPSEAVPTRNIREPGESSSPVPRLSASPSPAHAIEPLTSPAAGPSSTAPSRPAPGTSLATTTLRESAAPASSASPNTVASRTVPSGLASPPEAATSLAIPRDTASRAASEPAASSSPRPSLAATPSPTPGIQPLASSAPAGAAPASSITPSSRPEAGASFAGRTELRDAPVPSSSASRSTDSLPRGLAEVPQAAIPLPADARGATARDPRTSLGASVATHPETTHSAIAASRSSTVSPSVALQLQIESPPARATPAPVSIAPAPMVDLSVRADAAPTSVNRNLPAPDATFFGVAATGKRFAYVCDISGSMDKTIGDGDTKRVDVLKSELSTSLDALGGEAQYFICLFSDDAAILDDEVAWIGATREGKQWAHARMKEVEADGDTRPLRAFQVVLALDPKPDAIYFMTDGEFERGYVREIARLNEQLHIPIHCITFVSRRGERLMQKIAADSGGSYTHVPGPSPPEENPSP